MAETALYAQFRISLAHNAPRTLFETSVGTPAAISACATVSLDMVLAWTGSIDDQAAQQHWGWRAQYDLKAMVQDMLENLRPTRWP